MDKTLIIISILGGGAVSLTAIFVFIRGVYRVVRRIFHIADAVTQLRPNGGSSLADAINRIDKNVKEIDSRVKKLEERRRWLKF